MTTPEQDAFTWKAGFANGRVFSELNADEPQSVGHSFAEAQAEAEAEGTVIRTLELVSLVLDGWSMGRVEIPAGATPVCFRRRQRIYQVEEGREPQETGRTTIQCLGWQTKGPPDETQVGIYLFVFEDGSVFLSTNMQAV